MDSQRRILHPYPDARLIVRAVCVNRARTDLHGGRPRRWASLPEQLRWVPLTSLWSVGCWFRGTDYEHPQGDNRSTSREIRLARRKMARQRKSLDFMRIYRGKTIGEL